MALPSDRARRSDELVERARQWARSDPDPDTRRLTEDLVAAGDLDALEAGFAGPLRFGTAGLRGAIGPGPGQMNRATVRRAAAGLGAWLGPGHLVVIGHDARLLSDDFAEDSARVLAAAGIDVVRLPEPVPTPVLAFAVRSLGADAGVMVTASHNPAGDNGYKVYRGDGVQILPADGEEIAAAIDASPPADEIPLAAPDAPRIREDRAVQAAYVDHALTVVPDGPRRLRIAYTPLHGVAGAIARETFARAGFEDLHPVTEQADPDPDFPTVRFPNPEEPGALSGVLALARAVNADLVLAHDPDGDRLGVAVPDGAEWRVLSGDEVGCLLGADCLARTSAEHPLVVTTTVSDDLLAEIASDVGAECRRTLTGFKWIMRPAVDDPTVDFVFGYEEALGYAVDPYVRDKDGITAGLVFAALAARLAAEGLTVGDRLADLAVHHGLHGVRNWSLRDEGTRARGRLGGLVDRIRAAPPPTIAGVPVDRVVDYSRGEAGLPAADMLRFDAGDQRVILRPSGTEPKLKVYTRVIEPVHGRGDLRDARVRAERRLDQMQAEVSAILDG